MLLVAGVVVVLQVLTSGAGVAAAVMWTLRTRTRHQTPVLLTSGEQTTVRRGGKHGGIDAAYSSHSSLICIIVIVMGPCVLLKGFESDCNKTLCLSIVMHVL